MARAIIPGAANGAVVACDEGLSFWGGVDPATGRIIDAHHPQAGLSVAGAVVAMPTSRGSCSGSGVLLELALAGKAPAAFVFREAEDILTLGAMIATGMFDVPIPVIRVSGEEYERIVASSRARIGQETITLDAGDIPLDPGTGAGIDLSARDRAMLAGDEGDPLRLAMETLVAMADAQGAKRLIDVSRGHIDGCILAHSANLRFAEEMRDRGARVAIPTTINAISVDMERWRADGVPHDFGDQAQRLAQAYVDMGARPTFTCAPYLADDRPEEGEAIGWSESNAVIFANSVLGARTVKHPDYLDLFIAMTGRAPEAGVYLDEERQARIVIEVDLPDGADDAVWPMIGWLAGQRAPDSVPLLTGLEAAEPGQDGLKALCAAFGTTSGSPLLHIRGITPEGDLPPRADAPVDRITQADLISLWHRFNTAPQAIDLVSIGSPHASLSELHALAGLLDGRQVADGVSLVITAGRDTIAAARADGTHDRLTGAGATILGDLCWCSIVEPVMPEAAQVLMTNSGKYAHYAPGLSGRAVRFGSLADCASAAVTGQAPADPPVWLTRGSLSV